MMCSVIRSHYDVMVVIQTRTETPWHSIHGHGWSMAVPSLARPGPWMDQGWQSPLLSSLETKSPESSKQLTEAPFFEILSRL